MMKFSDIIEVLRTQVDPPDVMKFRRLYNYVRNQIGTELPYFTTKTGTVTDNEVSVDNLYHLISVTSGGYVLSHESAVPFFQMKDEEVTMQKQYTVLDQTLVFSDDMEGEDVHIIYTAFPSALTVAIGEDVELGVPAYYADAIGKLLLYNYYRMIDPRLADTFYKDYVTSCNAIRRKNTATKNRDIRNL